MTNTKYEKLIALKVSYIKKNKARKQRTTRIKIQLQLGIRDNQEQDITFINKAAQKQEEDRNSVNRGIKEKYMATNASKHGKDKVRNKKQIATRDFREFL